ncbi:MAG: hypothetical protein LBB21_00640 [Holosporaceae bacterium]|jgi:hypothetical protein|nr:hypothetical protein [Holosporaceae bacterium]
MKKNEISDLRQKIYCFLEYQTFKSLVVMSHFTVLNQWRQIVAPLCLITYDVLCTMYRCIRVHRGVFMISSVLMLFSQYRCNTNAVLMNACTVAWVFYAFSCSDFQLTQFTAINLAVFFTTTFFIRKIKNSYLNLYGAASSMLLYSVCVDIVCYFVYPRLVADQSLLMYIVNGLLFNYKYVFLNMLVLAFLVVLKKANLIQKYLPFPFCKNRALSAVS